MTESNERTLWAQFNWYDPTHPWIVLDPESEDELSYCEECPCPTPPACVPCDLHIGYWGYTWTNYQEIWGVGCDEDCDTEIHLLGTYDERDTLGVLGKSGCLWAEVDNTYDCLHWYGVDRACMPYHICDQRICDQDTCDIRKHSILNYCNAHGFYCNTSTGWLYPTGNPASLTPVTYHWITWFYYEEDNRYQATLHYLDCNCLQEDLASGSFIGTPPSSPADFGYSFVADGVACTPGCESTISAFIAQARENGWTLYGEGLLVRKTSAAYSCYRCDTGIIKVQMCADTGSSFVYISCSCSRGTIESGNPDFGGGYELYTFLEYAGCDCYDVRELLLSYPEMFGVMDVSFGDDTVCTKEYDSRSMDWDTQQMGPVVHHKSTQAGYLQSSHGWDAYWCDYRSMFVLFDNTCIGYSESDGYSTTKPTVFLSKLNVNGEWESRWSGSSRIYDSLTEESSAWSETTNVQMYFDGHIPPFVNAEMVREIWPDANGQWQGLTVRWYAINGGGGSADHDVAAFWTQQEAEDYLAQLNQRVPKYGANSFSASASNSVYFIPPRASMSPTFSPTHVEGKVEYQQYDGMYHVYEPYDDWGDGVVFNLNFVMTNKGFLINGQSGYTDTLQIPGFDSTRGEWTYPANLDSEINNMVSNGTATMCETQTEGGWPGEPEICPAGTIKTVTFQEGIMTVPIYNIVYKMTLEESMGGCQGDDWWPVDETEQED